MHLVGIGDQDREPLALQVGHHLAEPARERRRQPLEGFVESSIRVPAISARASATIFCWPPESSSELRARNAATSGMVEKIDCRRCSTPSVGVVQLGNRIFCSTVKSGTRRAVLGHVADPATDAAVRRQRQ